MNDFDVNLAFELLFLVLFVVVVNVFQSSWQPGFHRLKESIVPMHDGLATAPIGIQHLVVKCLVKSRFSI